jgi:Tfp pilus assembly protein PilF
MRADKTRGRHSRAASVWAQARHPKLQRYCNLLARAHTRLDRAPSEARQGALAADKLLPGRAAPQVVVARCALRDGDTKAALAAFELALKRDPRAVEQPLAMHDLAVTQWRAGQLKEALATYRILAPRASLLPSRSTRAEVLLQAAHLAMATAAREPDRTARHLVEALAYLREAARDPHQAHRLHIALSLVLALDRAGQRAQANAVLAEQRATAAWAKRSSTDTLAPPEDLDALRALALEQAQPVQAAGHWKRYLDAVGPDHPFRKAAKGRLAGLSKPKPRRRRPR